MIGISCQNTREVNCPPLALLPSATAGIWEPKYTDDKR